MNVWQSTNVAFLFLCMFGNLPAQCANALKNPMGSQSSGGLVGLEVLISHRLLQNTKIFQPAEKIWSSYPPASQCSRALSQVGGESPSAKCKDGGLGPLDPNLNLNIP